MRARVSQVAQPHAHIMVHWSGNGEANGDTQNGVRYGQRIEVAVLEKNKASGETPKQSNGHENRVRKMRHRKDDSRHSRPESRVWKQAQESRQEKALQQELLPEGPEGIARIGFDKKNRGAGYVQRVSRGSNGDGHSGSEQR